MQDTDFVFNGFPPSKISTSNATRKIIMHVHLLELNVSSSINQSHFIQSTKELLKVSCLKFNNKDSQASSGRMNSLHIICKQLQRRGSNKWYVEQIPRRTPRTLQSKTTGRCGTDGRVKISALLYTPCQQKPAFRLSVHT